MGRGGLYYRKFFSQGSRDRAQGQASEFSNRPEGASAIEEVASCDPAEMQDGSSRDLIEEIKRRRRRVRVAPLLVVAIGLVALAVATQGQPRQIAILTLVLGAAIAASVHYLYDELRKNVVLIYDLEDDAAARYQTLTDAFDDLRSSCATWRIQSRGYSADWKRNAGATQLIRRQRITLGIGDPPCVKTNLDVPKLPVARGALFFLPDRLLFASGSAVGAIAYGDLHVEQGPGRFIEDGAVPPDSEVVGYTWQYVNKDGTPDRRFSGNRRLPIVHYVNLHFSSATGLNELIQLSKPGVAAKFKEALSAIGNHTADQEHQEPAKEAPFSNADDNMEQEPLGKLEFRGGWRAVGRPEAEIEEERFAKEFAGNPWLGGKRSRAIGRNPQTADVLFWVPQAPSPLVVVHFDERDRHGVPQYTYFSDVTAWNTWSEDFGTAPRSTASSAGTGASPRPPRARVSVGCPNCAQTLRLDAPLWKRVFRCPSCGVRFRAGVAPDGRIKINPLQADSKAADPYETLGVRRGASAEEIRKAYRDRMREYHPDKVASLGPKLRTLAEQEAKRINEAYRAVTKDSGL